MYCDKGKISAVIAVAALYIFFAVTGIGCPIKFITGISCAGCGMTRAWLAVLHLDFKTAFYYHPLFWTIPPALAVLLLRRHFSKKILSILLFLFVLLFVIVYLYRMIWGDGHIVVFDPGNNIVFRIIRFVLRRKDYVLQQLRS